jgi:hypothetical protein
MHAHRLEGNMIRALLRLVIVVVVLVAIAMFFFGYRLGDLGIAVPGDGAVGTSGHGPSVNTEKARETGAAIGARVAEGANEAQHALANGALTAKIKSKIALDDTIKGARISVDTTDGAVTLSGTVGSEAERQRALQLARETAGVRSVADHLRIRPVPQG